MSYKWCTVAPVVYRDPKNQLHLPFNFEAGVVLDNIPAWLRDDKYVNYLNAVHRELLRKSGRFALSVEYTAEDLGSIDSDWKGKNPRAIQTSKHEAINLANLAIWLSKPCDFGFDGIFHLDSFDKEKNVRSFQQVRNLEAHLNYKKTYLQNSDLENARNLHKALLTLDRDSTVWIGVYSLWNALREPEWATRYLLFWIVLEALFGPEDGREITFRLSQRLGFFLSNNRSDAFALFETAKKGYGWRSKIVHGLHLSKLKGDQSIQLSFDTEDLVQKTISKILSAPNVIDEFNKRREIFLDQQIFI